MSLGDKFFAQQWKTTILEILNPLTTENFGKHDFYYYSIYSSQLKKFQQTLPEKNPLDQGNDSENLLKHRYDTHTAPEHLT